MGFLDAIQTGRDKAIIRNAFSTQQAGNDAEDAHVHDAVLRRIGRECAEEGLTLDDAYAKYEEYLEGIDSAFEDEAELEGEDPANMDDLYDEEDEH